MKFLKTIGILAILVVALFACQVDSSNQLGSNDQKDANIQKVDTSSPRPAAQTSFAGDRYYIVGDMILDRTVPAHQALIDAYSGKKAPVTSKGLARNTVSLWPNGIVEYYYWGDFTDAERNTIRSAMNSLELVCNVRFVESTIDWWRYEISKINDPTIGGQSTVGYIAEAAVQLNSISWGTCVHEFMHGLGIEHEHNRWDRQVTINWDNIIQEERYLSQFRAIPQESSWTYYEYDFDSIMHYPATAFSRNGGVTIDAGTNAIGQRNHLSEIDKRTLLNMYSYRGDQQFRLRNRWTNEYMHTESNYGWVEIGSIYPEWWSARWNIETSPRGFMHIKNCWTNRYLHDEGNSYYVQVGDINQDWWSAEWLPVEHEGTMRLLNRYSAKYPHIESRYGWLELSTIQPQWTSADWILEPVN